MSDRYDTLIVGAGYAGSILAEQLTTRCGQRVLVIDRRDHIGGNAFDYYDEHGVLVHQYGPHIFHTNSEKVVEYLSQFTEWRPYEHRVLANVDGKNVPIPINRTTINMLYGLGLSTDDEVEEFLAERAEPVDYIRNSEDVVVAKVGRELYEKFFRGYTRKQWQRDPSELAASVCARIPVRTNEDDRYFTDSFQNMPADGYTAMFERILDQPGIEVSVNTDYYDVADELEYDHLVWTGPIDRFFDHRFGALPYRSLEFELRNEPTPDGGLLFPAGQMNEPGERGAVHAEDGVPAPDGPGARVVHATRSSTRGPRASRTTRSRTTRRARSTSSTRRSAAELPDVTFVGRLARYQYLNMDQVVGQALSTADKLIASLPERA